MADRTSSSIVVHAARSTVMDIIADFPAYPEWAGAVRSAEIVEPGSDGRAQEVRFALDAGVIKDEYVLGYEWHGDDSVHWEIVQPGSVLSAMTGSYRLNALDQDRTEVIYELSVAVKIPMIGMFKRKAERVIIDTALKELKRRAEK